LSILAKDFHAPTDPWLPNGTPNSFGCKAGWIKFGGGCFRYFGDKSQGSTDSFYSHRRSDSQNYIEKAFQKSPYKSLDNEKKSWQDANDYCSQIWTGATLAIFPNQFYQSFATSLMTYYTEKPWIGLINEAQDRNFHWVRTVQFI